MLCQEYFLLPFFVCFIVCIAGLFLHSPFFIYLLTASRRKTGEKSAVSDDQQPPPLQIVQLPVFNEDVEMVKGLIDSACCLRYPKESLLIQLLDDSDVQKISQALKGYVRQKQQADPELQIVYLHRDSREGYKAGNLNFGLEEAESFLIGNGAFEPNNAIVSIFDADFLIPEDFLDCVTGYFSDNRVGAVQANMHFMNADESALTKSLSIFQENLHRIDFMGRSKSGHLAPFKGSAGSWRYQAIADCGFWQGDTQIEDVDLSFAAQAQGWKVVYTDRITCPSRLPDTYNSFKLQQRSWMKGLMEVLRKQLLPVLFSRNVRFVQKLLVVDFFFIFSMQSLCMIFSHLTLIPAYYFWISFAPSVLFHVLVLSLPLIMLVTHIPFLVLRLGNENVEETQGGSVSEMIFAFGLMTALFVTLTYGLIEGLLGVKVHRDRTGKSSHGAGASSFGKIPGKSKEKLREINRAEWIMAVYSLIVVGWAGANGFVGIALVYSVLALVYPINAAVSLALLAGERTLPGGRNG